MADKDIDIGLDPLHTVITRDEVVKKPCFGGCGKSYQEAGGGWFEFEGCGGQQRLAPRWFCNACSEFQSKQQDNNTKSSDPWKH